MAGSIDPVRDSVAWPVQPVTPPLANRPVRDLEAFSPAPDDAMEVWSHQESTVISGEKPGLEIVGVMNSNVISIDPESTVNDLEALLLAHRISGVPVVETKTGLLLGVVSQSDVLRYFAGREQCSGMSQGFHDTIWFDVVTASGSQKSGLARVWEIMTPYIYFATESSSILEVLDLMLKNQIHRVVITRDRKLVGVVTTMDILTHYQSKLRGEIAAG